MWRPSVIGGSRLAIPSAGTINASRSSTGANRSRCFITSALNSSIEASSAIRTGLCFPQHAAELEAVLKLGREPTTTA